MVLGYKGTVLVNGKGGQLHSWSYKWKSYPRSWKREKILGYAGESGRKKNVRGRKRGQNNLAHWISKIRPIKRWWRDFHLGNEKLVLT